MNVKVAVVLTYSSYTLLWGTQVPYIYWRMCTTKYPSGIWFTCAHSGACVLNQADDPPHWVEEIIRQQGWQETATCNKNRNDLAFLPIGVGWIDLFYFIFYYFGVVPHWVAQVYCGSAADEFTFLVVSIWIQAGPTAKLIWSLDRVVVMQAVLVLCLRELAYWSNMTEWHCGCRHPSHCSIQFTRISGKCWLSHSSTHSQSHDSASFQCVQCWPHSTTTSLWFPYFIQEARFCIPMLISYTYVVITNSSQPLRKLPWLLNNSIWHASKHMHIILNMNLSMCINITKVWSFTGSYISLSNHTTHCFKVCQWFSLFFSFIWVRPWLPKSREAIF